MLEPPDSGLASDDWEGAIAGTGLTPFGQSSSQSRLYMARKPTQEDGVDLTDSVYIIHAPEQAKLSSDVEQHITERLSRQGLRSQSVTWPPDTSKLVGKPLISLLELERPLLANISSSDFDTLKEVVLRCSSLTWVCGGTHPTTEATKGYLRVLKNENLNLNLRYLGLGEEIPNLGVEKTAQIISRVAMEPTVDREFAQIDGQICVSRWKPDYKLSRMIEESLSATETISLGDGPSGFKLVPGSSKSATHFTIDEARNCSLLTDEVEVEVKALALR
jgi:hypothetical protein